MKQYGASKTACSERVKRFLRRICGNGMFVTGTIAARSMR